MRFPGLRFVSLLQAQALFPEPRGLESWAGVGFPARPGPAAARLNLLFLDSSAEKDPGASGRGCLTREEELTVCSLLCSEKGMAISACETTVQALNSCE